MTFTSLGSNLGAMVRILSAHICPLKLATAAIHTHDESGLEEMILRVCWVLVVRVGIVPAWPLLSCTFVSLKQKSIGLPAAAESGKDGKMQCEMCSGVSDPKAAIRISE